MTTLRLADAIRLGSTLMTCGNFGFINESSDGKTSGCGLEMALGAVGSKNYHWTDAVKVWPWLRAESHDILGSVAYQIAGKFDCDVKLLRSLTIDQFCDWVDSIDPTPRCEPPVQEPSSVEVRQESTVSHG